jgi:16S rRNA (cytosine967-C5)-methyltransferase
VSRFNAYLRNAAAIITLYDGGLPFAVFIKQFFASNKKYGSKDRRQVTSLCFQYFRLGHLFDDFTLENKILIADFVFQKKASDVIANLKPDWIPYADLPVLYKMEIAGKKWDIDLHTPWRKLLQPETNSDEFGLSMFTQPNLFLRIRPGQKPVVQKKMQAAEIKPLWENDACLALPNGTQIDSVFNLNKEVVIQDFSSQLCGAAIKKVIPELNGQIWDACAASGGKTILIHDLYGSKLKWVVTDIRQSILRNLHQRLIEAGISNFKSFVADLTRPLLPELKKKTFEAAIIDAPCTGSGTWSRTPEQHYFFNPDDINQYSDRQLEICSNVVPQIKMNGYIIYITCSVFYLENKNIVISLQNRFKLQLLSEQVLNGMSHHADSMYIAILQKT